MTAHRVAWKILAIAVFTSSIVLALTAARLVAPLAPRGRVRREARIARTWARGTSRIMGMRVTPVGRPPQPPFLLVANHLSYMDVIALMSQIDARLLSKAEVKDWPIFGFLARFGGTLFVDRTRRTDLPRVIGEIRATLDEGHGVVFFPEGTSSAGLEVKPFKASLFEVPVRGELEVSVAALRYECPAGEPPAQWSVCWWGESPFGRHFLDVLRLSSFEATVRFGEERLRSDDRKQLAAACERAVREIFVPVCDELGPAPDESTAARALGTQLDA